MANIITAGNSTNGGTAITTDTSGTLNIVTGSGSGSNAITIDASQAVTMPGTLAVTGAQTVGGNLTVSGTLTASGGVSAANSLRAWVNFNGTGTVAIRGSGNVTSITDNGTGDYTVNFTTAMPDVNYATAVGGSRALVTNDYAFQAQIWSQSTGSFRMNTPTTSTGFGDWAQVCVSVFR